MWKKIALALGAIVVVFAAVVASRPSVYTVQRSITIAAPPGVIDDHIESPRAFDAWSPWPKFDPEMKIRYDGPETGVGAGSSWEGPKIGRGRVTVAAVQPGRRIDMDLEMLAPMTATQHVTFTLAPAGDATEVTWRLDGTHGFVSKAFSLFMDMDERVGGAFATGLASLKTVAEADAAQRGSEPATP